MPAPESWKVLADGSSGELILAVDFAVTGRPEASFSDLAPKLGSEPTIWESLPPPVSVGGDMTGADYLDRWLADVRASGREVRAVVGYCVGAVFACAIREHIATWQPVPPQLIVFDPESPLVPSLFRDYLGAIRMLASILTPEEVAAADEAGAAALQAGGDDFGTVGAELSRLFKETSNIAFDRVGLDEELREELTGTFGSFVQYLIAARQVDPLAGLAHATAITSSRSSHGAALAAREIRFDMDHEEVLRDDRVARAVRDVLAEHDAVRR